MKARGDDGTWRLFFVLGIGDLQFGGRRKQRKGNHVLRLLPSHLGWRHDVFRAGVCRDGPKNADKQSGRDAATEGCEKVMAFATARA